MNIPDPNFDLYDSVWFNPWTLIQRRKLSSGTSKELVTIRGCYYHLESKMWKYSTNSQICKAPQMIPEQYLEKTDR